MAKEKNPVNHQKCITNHLYFFKNYQSLEQRAVTVHLPGSIQRLCHVEHVKETGDGVTEVISLLLQETGEAKDSGPTSNSILYISCS